MKKQLVKKIKRQYTIEILTGLHIGGNSENVEIGGIDNAVIKLATRNNQPYIPGSSLKGKMRCLLEQSKGCCLGDSEEINNLFGWARTNLPSSVIFRDALLTNDSVKMLANNSNLDMPYTEGKWENVIDRVKGMADHPRQTERVPVGAKFEAEIIINVWKEEDGKTNEATSLALLDEGIRLLENDYLGGSGSRGYGQIKFKNQSEETVWSIENK